MCHPVPKAMSFLEHIDGALIYSTQLEPVYLHELSMVSCLKLERNTLGTFRGISGFELSFPMVT